MIPRCYVCTVCCDYIMETWKKPRKRRHGKGNLARNSNNSSQNQKKCRMKSGSEQKLCMLFNDAVERSISLLAIDVREDGLSDESFSIVEMATEMKCHWAPAVGFGSLGLLCYLIGGDANPYGSPAEEKRLPRNVLFCDLSCREKLWEKGPMLNGGKPDPIVVTVNGKIFALAGYSGMWMMSYEKPRNLFEVLDPVHGNFWRVLPEPPFFSLYAKGDPHPQFRGHTVIGSIIFLQIADLSDNITLYLFNVDADGYDCNSSAGLEDPLYPNLRLGDWLGRADVMDDLMFRTSEDELDYLSVYAYDLTARLKDHKDGESESSPDGEYFIEEQLSRENDKKSKYESCDFSSDKYVLLEDDNVSTVPVFGLNHTKHPIPDKDFDSFVTYLADNLFALVSCYTSYDSMGIRFSHVWVCFFEVYSFKISEGNKIIQRYVVAYNTRELNWNTSDLGMLITWCNVPNDGCQFHGDAFCHYVRQVNLDPHCF